MCSLYAPCPGGSIVLQRGVIVNIADMRPQTSDTHAAAKPAKYALEVNQGWFAKRGIKPGARIEGLERAPSAK